MDFYVRTKHKETINKFQYNCLNTGNSYTLLQRVTNPLLSLHPFRNRSACKCLKYISPKKYKKMDFYVRTKHKETINKFQYNSLNSGNAYTLLQRVTNPLLSLHPFRNRSACEFLKYISPKKYKKMEFYVRTKHKETINKFQYNCLNTGNSYTLLHRVTNPLISLHPFRNRSACEYFK